MHFSGLMYNARTDTLFEKPTFSRLALRKRSCVVALDGYFEWKSSPLAGGKGKKQPYFVYAKTPTDGTQAKASGTSKPGFLLLAGLWTRVPTGLPDEPFLDTFTILTTEACKQIEWLHHRMPVCLWDIALAKNWLHDPSPSVHEKIETAAKSNNEGFSWHMVTPDMSSVKFRAIEAIKEKKAPKPVIAYFSKMAETKSSAPSSMPPSVNLSTPATQPKRKCDQILGSSAGQATPTKKAKVSTPDCSKTKGLITSFFQKKC
jgi:putative SOS response-associated peptidase YedK